MMICDGFEHNRDVTGVGVVARKAYVQGFSQFLEAKYPLRNIQSDVTDAEFYSFELRKSDNDKNLIAFAHRRCREMYFPTNPGEIPRAQGSCSARIMEEE